MSDYLPSNQINIHNMAFREPSCSQTDYSPGLLTDFSYPEGQWLKNLILDGNLPNDTKMNTIENTHQIDTVTNYTAVNNITVDPNIMAFNNNYLAIIGNIAYDNSLAVNQQLPAITNGLDLTGGDTASPISGYPSAQAFVAPTIDYMAATQPWIHNLPVVDVNFEATTDRFQAPEIPLVPNCNHFGHDSTAPLPSTNQMACNVPFVSQNIATPISVPQNSKPRSRLYSPEPMKRQPGQKGRSIMSDAQFLHKQKKLRTGELIETAGAKVKYAPPPHSGMSGNCKHICQFCNQRFGNGPRMEDTVGPQHPNSTDKVCVPLEGNRDAHEKHQSWLNKSSRKSKFDC